MTDLLEGATPDASGTTPDASGTTPDASGTTSDVGRAAPDVDHGHRACEPARIRARRRPRAIFFVWLWELVCAFFVATPIHAWAARVWGANPDGDAALFRPGGHALLSWLGEDGPTLGVVLRTSTLALVVFAVLGQIVTGALVASLATEDEDGRAPKTSFALQVGLGSFFPLLGVGVVFGALEAFVLGVGLFASSAVDHGLQARVGDAGAFTARVVVLAVFVVAMLVIGVASDLARVAIARGVALDVDRSDSLRARMQNGVLAAIRTAQTSLGRASLAWGWRAALSLALVYLGALAGDFVGARGGTALWLLFVFHQLIVLARATLRASWLANALRLVAR